MSVGLEIHEAASTGDYDALEEYLRSGKFDVNLKDEEWGNRTALHWACAKGYVECIRLLLDHGAIGTAHTDVGWTPAHFAAETGRLTVLRALHNASIPIGIKDKYGDTPKKIATIYGHSECAKYLEQCEAIEATLPMTSVTRSLSGLRRKRSSSVNSRRSTRKSSASSTGGNPPSCPTSPKPVFGSAEEDQADKGIDNSIQVSLDPERES